jgi:hypothetical protein
MVARIPVIFHMLMRAIMCWGLLWPLGAATFFVTPQGRDENAGTLDQPFATVMRAQQSVKPGDVVYLRGGIYSFRDDQIAKKESVRALVCLFDRSGEQGKPIRYEAYQDEEVILDFSQVKPAAFRVHGFRVTASWLHFRKLTLTGIQVTIKGHTQSINVENLGNHNVYEQLVMRDGQGIGFWLGRGSHNLVLNCDAYHNHDSTSEGGRGGNVDGFGFHVPKGSVNNVFRGCRAWFNSDDGFDSINTSEAVLIENCWAFYNGYGKKFESLGDGNGFKVGGYGYAPADRLPKVIPRHRVIGCIAARNKASGFYSNHQVGGIDFLHNSAYRNRCNFNMLGRLRDPAKDVPGYGHVLKNNFGLRGGKEIDQLDRDQCEVSHNSFDFSKSVTERDVETVDETQLMRPRQPNGDLPVIDFLKPKASTPMIDAGVEVGRPYRGKKPDIGAIER